MAVALDPRSGEILAMASYPVANANAPRSADGLRDRPVADAFEPGSTIKTFTIAAALDQGAVSPRDNIPHRIDANTIPAAVLLGDDDGGRFFHPYGPREYFGRATLAGARGLRHPAHVARGVGKRGGYGRGSRDNCSCGRTGHGPATVKIATRANRSPMSPGRGGIIFDVRQRSHPLEITNDSYISSLSSGKKGIRAATMGSPAVSIRFGISLKLAIPPLTAAQAEAE